MDDLLVYLILLFTTDPLLQAIFQNSGSSTVQVVDPENREAATYPKLVLEGEEGEQLNYGDLALPKFFKSKVRVEITTRQSTECPAPLAVLNQIKARQRVLVLGNASLGLLGIKGVQLGTSYNVSGAHQCNPTRRLPVTEPTLKKHLTTYDVLLNDITL